jgi:hypothetical protein
VLSFLLIWLADKWDTAGSLYHQGRSLWGSTWARCKGKGKGVDDFGSGRSDKGDMTPEDSKRKMSV